MSVNKVILMGYTGKDPDVKTFDNGGVVAQFTLATTKRGFKTKDGKEIPERLGKHNKLHHREHEKRDKQQLHVLPGRLVDRRKHRDRKQQAGSQGSRVP